MPCPRSSVRSERDRAKVEVAGAIPAVDAIFALVPQQLQGGFRKPVFVGASPTRGSTLYAHIEPLRDRMNASYNRC